MGKVPWKSPTLEARVGAAPAGNGMLALAGSHHPPEVLSTSGPAVGTRRAGGSAGSTMTQLSWDTLHAR